jgi:hypothetical protein
MSVNQDGSISVQSTPLSSPGKGGGYAITSTASIVSGAHPRMYLMVANAGSTNPMSCAFGVTPTAGAAGTFTVAANGNVVFAGPWVPSDYLSCISASGTNATVIEH